jgi:opacity protein-like surface antigen
MTIARKIWLAVSLAATVLVCTSMAGANQTGIDPYWRAALVYEMFRDTHFSDTHCEAGNNYFGCVDGEDGRPIGAYGDFGNSLGAELALGLRVHPVWRVELTLGGQTNMKFKGNANFLGAGERQPVTGDASQVRLFTMNYIDIAPLLKIDLGFFQPFVGAGIGMARNKIKTMTYAFPEFQNQPSYTTVPGDSHWNMMWTLSAGTAIRIMPRSFIDLAYSYSDYGWMQTAGSQIDVVRGEGSVARFPVEPTRAKLRSQGILMGFRHHF